ncbi:unnamed protein product [Ixodes persulcatus]
MVALKCPEIGAMVQSSPICPTANSCPIQIENYFRESTPVKLTFLSYYYQTSQAPTSPHAERHNIQTSSPPAQDRGNNKHTAQDLRHNSCLRPCC